MPKIWKFSNLGESSELKYICVFILDPNMLGCTHMGGGMVLHIAA